LILAQLPAADKRREAFTGTMYWVLARLASLLVFPQCIN
jgi:hypothetical protein